MTDSPLQLLKPSVQISTGFGCNNCHISIDRISWAQCNICHMFDLCHTCAEPKHVLSQATEDNHRELHRRYASSAPITSGCMVLTHISDAKKYASKNQAEMIKSVVDNTRNKQKIKNDYQVHPVMTRLKEIEDKLQSGSEDESTSQSLKAEQSELFKIIGKYHMQGHATNIHVLSLDGGGIRGYMPIQILIQLISKEYLGLDGTALDINKENDMKKFIEAQKKFTREIDYFVGTSTGGIIAFCLATNYNMYKLKDLYTRFSHFFKRKFHPIGGLPLLSDKYDPCNIHAKIHEIIDEMELKDSNGKLLSHEQVTVFDIHKFLNNPVINNLQEYTLAHGNLIEFVDDESDLPCVKREKVLLITAYDATSNSMTVFNTSYAPHWNYRIADVIKATMAAPVFFPSHVIPTKIEKDGKFELEEHVYLDGGVFANDPELAGLWAIRMQWKKPVNYHLLSIGTGCSNTPAPSGGGYAGWLSKGGLVVTTLMDATRSLTETVMNNLAKFDSMKRIKFNYSLQKSMDLDDENFVKQFDHDWKTLKDGKDFTELVHFYNMHIKGKQN